jgi:hypothetical protein
LSRLSDREFLLSVLADGDEHTLNEIIIRSFKERGCGLTVHSRAADLRRSGYLIENRPMPDRSRGSVYRLAGRPLEGAADGAAPSSGSPRGPEPSADAAAVTAPAAPSSSVRAPASDPEPLELFPVARGAYTEEAA